MGPNPHESSVRHADYETARNETLTNIVDYRAKKTPQALYAEFPVSATSYDAGYRKINYAQIANAINGVAWWLNKTLGPGKDFETLAYIGPNDMRYNVLILGAVKAGYKVRDGTDCVSFRNMLHLLIKTCHRCSSPLHAIALLPILTCLSF